MIFNSLSESTSLLGEDAINFDEIQEAEDCLYGLDEEFNPIEGAAEIAYESEVNYNKFCEATCYMEVQSFIEEGTTAIYETSNGSGKIKAWFEKAKGYIKKWAAYVKAFFKKCFAMLESLFTSDQKFVKDNRARIESAGGMDAKFSGYKFTLDAVAYLPEDAWKAGIIDVDNYDKDAYENVTKKLEDDMDDALSSARSKIAGGGSDVTTKEFKQAMFEKFRNGESNKSEMTIAAAYGSAKELVDAIANTAKAKTAANKAYDAEKKSINKAIKTINDMKKKVESKDDDKDTKMKAANKSIEYLKQILRIENTAHGIYVQAIKANNRQARACCSHILYKNVKVKDMAKDSLSKKNESFDFDTDSSLAALSNLDF